jgi:MoCo/4Fe-4S cofactor protein with predicted Tat translocation signal
MAEIDVAALRRRLNGTGREYWRSLEDLADSPEFLDLLEREFPRQAAAMFEGGATDLDRRGFLRLMGASLALAGLGSACTRQPTEKILPYVKSPEQIVPGEPLFYATAMPLAGTATGLLVESHTGRPTKIEGNPSHPASLGATDAFAQASILTLYDPDRSQVVRRIGEIVPWTQFEQAIATLAETARGNQGAGLRILSGTVSSPTLAAQMRELKQSYPRARWHQYEPVSGGARAGARAAFGRDADVLLHLDRSDSVLALDSVFLVRGRGAVRHARDFASRRRPRREASEMSRLWVVESSPTPTGTRADERLALAPRQIHDLALAVAARLGVDVPSPPSMEPHRAWIDAVAADLRAHAGRSAVVVGDQQSAGIHALGHAMNERLGNLGTTVVAIEPVAADPSDPIAGLADLVAAMKAGEVELLLILDSNPVYDAPADLDFVPALAKVRTAVSLGLYDDETAIHCQWHVPMAHYLESWGDARAYDGTVTLLQPLIAPLYDGKTAIELLEVVLGRPPRSAYEIVREHWQKERPGSAFETFWARSLNDGVVDGTTSPALRVSLQSGWRGALVEPPGAPEAATSEAERVEALFRPDRKVLDGRFANNAWLQELPDALTKLTWDNAVLIAPALGERLGLRNGDLVELELGGRTVSGPVWLTPGHADRCATLPLGYGRTRAGRVGDGVGFDAYRLRTSAAPDQMPGLALRATGEHRALACTQAHGALEGRPIVRGADLAEFRANPAFAHELGEDPPADESLYPNYPYEGHSWGMAVDLNACVGCNACIVACQSENNIPVVGREQVAMGREMQWIRLDRYYSGPVDDPETHFQPMLCQHCERAPCEVVCPVNATVHDGEGLNVMVYNRCVGTRYCANNCPYKVRRFNFYLYSDWHTKSLKLQRNPNVTVRSRGVMEKCTYCVQRISRGRIDARRDGRKLEDGSVRTACQQVCPAEAIHFGDLNDPESRIVRAKSDPRNYSVLAELNTRPRTTYLAEVRNPDPKRKSEEDA